MVSPSFAGAVTASDFLGLRANDKEKTVRVRGLPHGVLSEGSHIYLGWASHNKRHTVAAPM